MGSFSPKHPEGNASSSEPGNLVRRTRGGSLEDSMHSVIVTITGYKALERANLIKLINRTGAAFTGKWTPRHTHLVCWNYNGAKFEMAKKSGTTILLNHRWFEECLNENCRLPEHPYTLLSGEEIGPLRWVDIADEGTTPNRTTPNRCLQNRDLGKRVMDATEDAGCSSGQPHSIYITMGQPLEGRQEAGPSAVHGYDTQVELAGGSTPATSRQVGVTSASCSLDAGRLPSTAGDDEDLFFLRKRHQGPGIPAPRNKSRRLVRKTNAEHQPTSLEQSSDGVEDILTKRTTDFSAFNDPCTPLQASASPHIFELPRQQAVFPESPEYGAPIVEVPVAQQDEGTPPMVPPAARSPEAKVACVICYTEKITEKEGVLGCGHKFCFPCIHRWATDSKSKIPECPLCKAPFSKLIKRDWSSSSGNGAKPHEDEEIIVRELPGPTAIVNIRRVLPPPPTARTATPSPCISCWRTDSQDLLYVCNFCPDQPRAMHVHCVQPARVLERWLCPTCTLLQEQIWSTHRFLDRPAK